MQKMRNKEKGLIAVFTGNGKGKTSAALGMIVRSSGYGKKVCMIQFIKGDWKCGEHDGVKHFGDLVEIHTMGKGFTWKSEDIEKDIKLAREAWAFAVQTIQEANYSMIILDELTYLIKYNMVEENDILDVLKNKPEDLHIVITGRDASAGLIGIADLVTEMKEIKHPFSKGVSAQPGFDY